MKKSDLQLNYLATIHHGINVSKYPFLKKGNDDYLLFVGRLIPEKGADDAVNMAVEHNYRLLLAYEKASTNPTKSHINANNALLCSPSILRTPSYFIFFSSSSFII